ncbi:MAG: CHASE3 domain-containing protein [Pseudobdellovibrio sp.]
MQVKLPKQTKLIGFLLFLLCFLALKVWFLNKSFRSVVEQNNLVVHTNEVMNQLEMILSSTKDAESGVRGFLLTKDAVHLDTYQQGVTNAKNQLNQLNILISDNQEQLDASQVTEDILTRRFKILEEILKSYNLKQDLKLVDRLNNSRVLMDNLRKQINKMKETEKKLLLTRDADLASLQYLFKWVLFLSNVFLSAILIYIFLHVIKSQNKLALDAKLKELENYTKTLIAQLASKLAGDLSLEQASNLILNFFTSEFKALAAKMYRYENNKLVEVSSTGVPLNKNFAASAFAYSIFQKNEIIKINDIPQDFWTIDTALGRKKPDILLYIPITHLNKKIGLIELAGFNSCFYKNSIEVNMGSFAEAIGSGVNAAIVKDTLTELLLKLKSKLRSYKHNKNNFVHLTKNLNNKHKNLKYNSKF